MALFGRRKRTQQCLLLGEERTRAGRYSTSANDPERTFPSASAEFVRGSRLAIRSHVTGCSQYLTRRPQLIYQFSKSFIADGRVRIP